MIKITLPGTEHTNEAIHVLKDGPNLTFIHESVYNGPCDGEGEEWDIALRPSFSVLSPEEVEASPELLSYIEAVKKGEQDSDPCSATRFRSRQVRRDRGH